MIVYSENGRWHDVNSGRHYSEKHITRLMQAGVSVEKIEIKESDEDEQENESQVTDERFSVEQEDDPDSSESTVTKIGETPRRETADQ